MTLTLGIVCPAAFASGARKPSKPHKHDTRGQLPSGHYTGKIKGTVTFTMAAGGQLPFSGSGSADFTGTLDLTIAKKGALSGTGTLNMAFKYHLDLPPGIPQVNGTSDVNASAQGALEMPATLVGVNLYKGFTMAGDLQGAGKFGANINAGGSTAATSASGSGGDHVEVTFKAGTSGVTCSRVPAGTWTSPTVTNMIAGLQGSGWTVDTPKLLWNLKADTATQARLDKNECDDFVPTPLTRG